MKKTLLKRKTPMQRAAIRTAATTIKPGQCVYLGEHGKVKGVRAFGSTLYVHKLELRPRKPLPRQSTDPISKLEQKLDALAHEIVCRRDPVCQKCGGNFSRYSDSPERREVHHLLGRGKSVRWLTILQAALHRHCHDRFTRYQEEAKAWARSWLTVMLYDRFDVLARRPVPVTLDFLETTEARLRKELKELKR